MPESDDDREALVRENESVRASLLRGLREAHDGKTRRRDDFLEGVECVPLSTERFEGFRAGDPSLTDFLLARIAEDEADVEDRATRAVGHSPFCTFEGGYEGTAACDCGAVRRALAECDAKRRIVEEALGFWPELDRDELVFDGTLRALASIYADHPDYRDEWR